MALHEVIGQCRKCRDLISIELESHPSPRGAEVRQEQRYFRIVPGRNYTFTRHVLTHQGIVVPCGGIIALRGGLTPFYDYEEPYPTSVSKTRLA